MFFKKISVPTVAAALQGFHKAIADLKAVKEHHDAEAGKQEAALAKAQDGLVSTITRAEAEYHSVVARALDLRDTLVTKADELREAAEAEARAAAVAIARVEQFIGL